MKLQEFVKCMYFIFLHFFFLVGPFFHFFFFFRDGVVLNFQLDFFSGNIKNNISVFNFLEKEEKSSS